MDLAKSEEERKELARSLAALKAQFADSLDQWHGAQAEASSAAAHAAAHHAPAAPAPAAQQAAPTASKTSPAKPAGPASSSASSASAASAAAAASHKAALASTSLLEQSAAIPVSLYGRAPSPPSAVPGDESLHAHSQHHAQHRVSSPPTVQAARAGHVRGAADYEDEDEDDDDDYY